MQITNSRSGPPNGPKSNLPNIAAKRARLLATRKLWRHPRAHSNTRRILAVPLVREGHIVLCLAGDCTPNSRTAGSICSSRGPALRSPTTPNRIARSREVGARLFIVD